MASISLNFGWRTACRIIQNRVDNIFHKYLKLPKTLPRIDIGSNISVKILVLVKESVIKFNWAGQRQRIIIEIKSGEILIISDQEDSESDGYSIILDGTKVKINFSNNGVRLLGVWINNNADFKSHNIYILKVVKVSALQSEESILYSINNDDILGKIMKIKIATIKELYGCIFNNINHIRNNRSNICLVIRRFKSFSAE
ncbi:hypothetical protein RhiirA4_550538 [Rhizophagus irregularis]|uniref:Uncharacterized protein n=1 Tax=Rhizophagus irregularis TaxID=588596 RepID=A0A2I1HMA3_9GLOM|nr:hypothetical protein RhiirA4_550538 [Rhizophagus irregularis]